MSGAVPLLPVYAFMAWTGKHLPSYILVFFFLFASVLNWRMRFVDAANVLTCIQEVPGSKLGRDIDCCFSWGFS